MTINESQNKIITEMSGLDDWFDKYQYLIDLGKKLPALPSHLKNDENAIAGCQSNAWVYGELQNGIVLLQMESDSAITRGMMALLIRVLNEQAPQEIAQADLFFLQEIGLLDHLSPSRANGLQAVVTKMKNIAHNFIVQNPPKR